MRFIRVLNLTLLGAVLATACSSAPKKYRGSSSVTTGPGGPGGGGGAGDVVADEKAFELTLYPVLVKNCATCHSEAQAPLFAKADPMESYKGVVETAKVDLLDPTRSRMYLKVYEDQHQCWSGDCIADGTEILEQIEAWKAMAAGGSVDPLADIKFKSDELSMSTAKEVEPRDVDPASIVLQAESGTFAGVMASSEVLSANGGRVIGVPAGTAVQNSGVASPNGATFTFNVTVAGAYRLLVKANATAAARDTLHFGIDAAPTSANLNAAMRLNLTGDGEFLWTVANVNNPAVPSAAVTLAAGPHTVNLRQAEAGVMVDMVALSSNPAFQGSDTVSGSKVKLLSFDISDTCGVPGTTFEIEAADHQGQGYKFKNPIIKGTAAVKVKGIGIIVNGKPNAQYSTFKLVDTTVAPGATTVLANGAMIVLKEGDDDKYAFSFEECTGG